MRLGRFFWKLFAGNALLMAVILGVSTWVIIAAIERAHLQEVTAQLRTTATHIRNKVAQKRLFDPSERPALQSLAGDLGGMETAYRRVTIISANGDVWADSDADAGRMESHATRPEVIAALATGYGESRRWSDTVQREMVYVAVRVDGAASAEGEPPAPIGIVRVSMPVFQIAAQTGTMRQLIWNIAGLGLVAALLSALGLAYVRSAPIRRITEAARSLSKGDLSARTVVRGSDEIAQMADSLNQMRASLSMQLETIEQQRRSLEYFIQTLSEGVVVAGADGNIVLINQAACRLLDPVGFDRGALPRAGEAGISSSGLLSIHRLVGRPLDECIPHPELRQLFVGESGDAGDVANHRVVQELPLHVEQPTGTVHLLARASDIDLHGGVVRNGASAAGRLVVLTDVTELTRTIRMKTDFVANASHELRTPLSTIRASVETLQHMDLARDGDSARHFIGVIERHTARLEELVSDLLDLSRLESSGAAFSPERIDLTDFLDELYGRFEQTIKRKGLLWEGTSAMDETEIRANGRLLRLVLDNLVSNAIKFTDSGGWIRVVCARDEGGVAISVRDEGCGIPKSEQTRVFERFYQVEAARSETGTAIGVKRGTGLGLSIVRHAVAAMGATVALDSEVGRGTNVTVYLPNKP